MKLRITAGKVALEVELRDTPTTRALAQALPFEASAQTWFWTEGDALALPYGRTPISTDERPKLAAIKAGQKIRVEKI